MHRIVVLNSKGGSGKTTVATNMAAALASAGHSPALMDFDPQGSSMRWLERRELSRRPIRGIAAYEVSGGVTRAYQRVYPHAGAWKQAAGRKYTLLRREYLSQKA